MTFHSRNLAQSFILSCGLGLFALAASAQIEVQLSFDKEQYLLYEPIEAKVKLLTLSDPVNLSRPGEKTPWLDFFVTTQEDEEVDHTDRAWIPPRMILMQNQVKTVAVNLIPLFQIREPGGYKASAQITFNGKQINSSAVKFTIVSGTSIWKQRYTAPADPADPAKKLRPRLYSLLIHRNLSGHMTYARIQNVEEEKVYCTTPLGSIVNYGDPKAKIDSKGNFHVFHQSGTRIFNYTRFSPLGTRLSTRWFSNLSSPPSMATLEDGEIEIIGGEEYFPDKDPKGQQTIPTPPVARPPAK
jgi:hypothetical protein